MTARIAVVAMAYGTPRTPEEILPYYTDIRRGRVPTDEQLADLTRRYAAIGASRHWPRTEAQRAALQSALDVTAPGTYEVVLGLKHAAPKIETAVESLAAAGFERIVGLVLAPHYSAFSVGEYLGRLRETAAVHGISVAGVEHWGTEPAFVDFIAADLAPRLAAMPADTRVLFTAHSLPQRILANGDPYPDELRGTAEVVATKVGLDPAQWSIAWQSAGRTPEPWIGPDILEVIDALAADHVSGVLVSAVGFVADHLEVLYDLDIEASARAASHGMRFDRTACVNDDPAVMTALAQRVVELG